MNNILKAVGLFLGVNLFTWVLYFIVINNLPTEWVGNGSVAIPTAISVISMIITGMWIAVDMIDHYP